MISFGGDLPLITVRIAAKETIKKMVFELYLSPAGPDTVEIEARVKTTGPTGVEMEALTAVSVAATPAQTSQAAGHHHQPYGRLLHNIGRASIGTPAAAQYAAHSRSEGHPWKVLSSASSPSTKSEGIPTPSHS